MDVFQYLSPYLVLQAYYQSRKKYEKGFSYSVWAEELGLKSGSTLRIVVHGKKKLSGAITEKFIEKNLMTSHEKNYFRLLVMYEHAPSASAKSMAWKSLSQILLERVEQKEDFDYLTYLSDPLLPKLQTMLSFEDYAWSDELLAFSLKTPVSVVQEALRRLESIGLAKATEASGQTIWKAIDRLLKVGDKLGDVTVAAYHNACLDEAKEAHSLPVEERRYKSLLLPISQTELESLHKEINAFVKQLIASYQADKYSDRKLFKLNINYFSVTETLTQ